MKNVLLKFVKTHYLIVIFLLFYFFITATKFVTSPTPFYDWDESIYAQVGREMVRQKSAIPLWQGQFWLDKPPLVPLAYGIVENIFPKYPELSTRIFTLFLAIFVLSLTYVIYSRLTKNTIIPTLAIIITSFTTIFLQRTQVLNVDVFLLLGWLGYIVFYDNFWISLLFLAIGVLSKSVLGFYPIIAYFCLYTFQLISKQIKQKDYKKFLTKLFIQSSVLLFWYVVMFAIFKMSFIRAHFYDSLLKRVTSSIESHFGKRTFYIDLLFNQLGNYVLLSVIGLIAVTREFFKKKDYRSVMFAVFFVPWFLFLNATKTKIDWYLYPVLAQFAFLAVYLLQIIKKYKFLSYSLFLLITFFIIKDNVASGAFFNTHYSNYDDSYRLALYAKGNCQSINLLVDRGSRQTHDTLKNMNLLIGTSEWWGNHPSMVYYSDKKVNFIYETALFNLSLKEGNKYDCYVIDKGDSPAFTDIKNTVLFGDFLLFKK